MICRQLTSTETLLCTSLLGRIVSSVSRESMPSKSKEECTFYGLCAFKKNKKRNILSKMKKKCVYRLFLSRGANVFLRNREGETPPDCCSHNSKAWAVLQANRKERGSNSSMDRAEEKVLHRLNMIVIVVERTAPFIFMKAPRSSF